MAFFTSQQLFGDGAGAPGSPGWVPIDTAAPPSFSANNRGIAFGEQLTSAIANRSHYALALNTDDLNTRLALFETGGLDEAYRLGAAAVPGGGRIINKDGGAVESVSLLASQYADDIANAHFRANAIGDSSRGGGFDARMALAQTAYGYISRRSMGLSAGGSTLLTSQAGTLNPASAGGTIVRLGGGSVAHTAGVTGVGLLGMDFLEVSGAGAGVDGLYMIHSLGPTNNDFIVRRLDGTSPTFTADTAVTVRVFRASAILDYNFGAIGPAVRAGLAVAGTQSDIQALAIFSNDVNGSVGTGSTDAISFFTRSTAGVISRSAQLTGVGQHRSTFSGALWAATARDAEMRDWGGIVGHLDDRSSSVAGTHEVGVLFKELLDGATTRSAMENWQRITETAVLGVQPSINGTFAAPSGRVLLPDSDGTPAAPTGLLKWSWALAVLPGITVVEMLTGSNAGEHYLLQKVTLTGVSAVDPVADEITLIDMDGNPASLPVAGNFTFRFVARDLYSSKMPPVELVSSPDSAWSASETASYSNFFQPQRGTADHSRALGVAGDIAGGVAASGASPGDLFLEETWVINSDGSIQTVGNVRADTMTLSGTTGYVLMTGTIERTINHHLANGTPEMDATGVGQWWFDQPNGVWVALVADAVIYFPILFTGRLMDTDVQVFNAAGALHDITASLQSVEPVWGTPGTAPTIVNSNPSTNFANGAWGEINISHSLGSGTVIGLSTKSYAIRVEAGRIGDQIRALRHVVRFTNIGGGGIGS